MSNTEELVGLALLVNQGHTFKDTVIVLTSDIDLGSHYWTIKGVQQIINLIVYEQSKRWGKVVDIIKNQKKAA